MSALAEPPPSLLEPEGQNVSKRVLEGLVFPEPGCSGLYYRHRETGRLSPLRCGTLNCPTCGPTVRWAVSEAIREAVEVFGLSHLWTFTMPGTAYEGRGDPLQSRKDLMEGWNVIRTRLAQLGAFSEFVAVVEFQKDGTAHLHVGAKGFVPWELVNRLAKQAGLGFVWVSGPGTRRRGKVPHIRGPAELAEYLAKYLTKATRERPARLDLYYCLQDGRQRKAPLRTYTASRKVGRAIAEVRERLKNVTHNPDWEVIRLWFNHAGEPQEDPVHHGEPSSRVESCPGHRNPAPWNEVSPCLRPPRKRATGVGPSEARQSERSEEARPSPVGEILTFRTILRPSLLGLDEGSLEVRMSISQPVPRRRPHG